MGNFSSSEKLPKQEAINSLILKVSEYCDGRYDAFLTSDDGGAVLELMIEVPEPSQSFEEQVHSFPPLFDIIPEWGGWRTVIMKVPPGYIDCIHLKNDE
tara:strand:- start:3301 stop:3597 length:297 start_codon:yes stop_codon:yes gene_type:complete